MFFGLWLRGARGKYGSAKGISAKSGVVGSIYDLSKGTAVRWWPTDGWMARWSLFKRWRCSRREKGGEGREKIGKEENKFFG